MNRLIYTATAVVVIAYTIVYTIESKKQNFPTYSTISSVSVSNYSAPAPVYSSANMTAYKPMTSGSYKHDYMSERITDKEFAFNNHPSSYTLMQAETPALQSSAMVRSYISGGATAGSNGVAANGGGTSIVNKTPASVNDNISAYTIPFAAAGIGGGQLVDEQTVGVGRTRRGALGTDDEDLRPGYDREDPYQTPIGKVPILFMGALVLGYTAIRSHRRKVEGKVLTF